ASKEWVVPAKPKPGRKPKKEATSVPKEEDEIDGKGRRVQNRAAQRAFRERKQSQLAELQARVQQYEQGEIERNVALQAVAKRLKEENDKLRQENQRLKEQVDKYERERELGSDRKRWKDDSLDRAGMFSSEYPPKKKLKLTVESLGSIAAFSTQYLPSPSSSASSPDSNASRNTSGYSNRISTMGNFFDIPSTDRPSNLFESGPPFTLDCGFCADGTTCVCRVLALQQMNDALRPSSQNSVDSKPVLPLNDLVYSASSPRSSSILDNLPAYQPPVPLRRRNAGSTSNSIFPVSLPQANFASCSGDPSNCMACADDPFGREFCAAISKSVASAAPCDDCPSGLEVAVGRCSCGSKPCSCPSSSAAPPLTPSGSRSTPEVISTDDAWRQIKSHPNVAFSDLSLLADVVARRSKCSGPTVVISPAPGSRQRERSESASTTPRLVPQDVLVRCGRGAGVREVYTDGVREALRLLDAKFS
ncbi:hypothetical protein JAAARDRAFT_115096, partial [Jaapia argillacea MUCL 33604]